MKSIDRYYKIIRNTEGNEALENSFVVPKGFVPYSLALYELERQEFPNFLVDAGNKDLRNLLAFQKICMNKHYIEKRNTNLDIRQAELQHQKAKVCLNDALIKGFIKSYIFKFDEVEDLCDQPIALKPEWWRSKKAFNIDGLSFYFIETSKDKFVTDGLIALDRKSLEKWGAAHPYDPNLIGRKKGSGGIDDTEAIKYMSTLVEEGQSVYRSAQLAVQKLGVKGASEASDVTRLRTKYSSNTETCN